MAEKTAKVKTTAKKAMEAEGSDRRNVALEATVDLDGRTLEVRLANGETVKLPLSAVLESPSGLVMMSSRAKVDFSKPRLDEYGVGISFGMNFDCGIDTLVMECDFLNDPDGFEERWYEPVLRHIEVYDRNGRIMEDMRERLERQRERLKRRP